MLTDHEDDAPIGDESSQPVARRLVSDDGVNWRPHDWRSDDGRRARFERVEIMQADA